MNSIDIKKSSSELLAAHIIAYRVIGFNKDFALLCMSELALRRENGEDFDYESFIEEKIKEMPKPQVAKTPMLINMINQAAETFNNDR